MVCVRVSVSVRVKVGVRARASNETSSPSPNLHNIRCHRVNHHSGDLGPDRGSSHEGARGSSHEWVRGGSHQRVRGGSHEWVRGGSHEGARGGLCGSAIKLIIREDGEVTRLFEFNIRSRHGSETSRVLSILTSPMTMAPLG